MRKEILFCGGGNMAEGIMKAILKSELGAASNITVSEVAADRCQYLNETYGVAASQDAVSKAGEAHLIIIAVNPHQMESVTSELRDTVGTNTIIMSIAAGVTVSALEKQLGKNKKIVRMMPNTLSQSGNGYSAACVNGQINETDRAFVTDVLTALGQSMFIEENLFDTFTGFCCTCPFWLYKMVEALIDAGVYSGFRRAEARDMVIKNMLGVAQVLEITGASPVAKVDELTSPKGVTIEALKSLQENGFASAIMASVNAAVRKANALGE